MKKLKFLIIASGLAFVAGCSDEAEITPNQEGKTLLIETLGDGTQLSISESERLAEMKALSKQLYAWSKGETKPEDNGRTDDFSVPPPYFSSNTGEVYKNRPPAGQSDLSDNLNFGNRAPEHTTQWIDLALDGTIGVTDVGGAGNNIGRGTLSFFLSGVRQTVYLDHIIGRRTINGTRIEVKPRTSGTFLRHNVSPAPILYGQGEIRVTIHANEFGWIWVRVTQGGLIKFDANYRFNYSSNNDNRNGGRVNISGFNRVGNSIPYSVFWSQQSYSGYCGWFRE